MMKFLFLLLLFIGCQKAIIEPPPEHLYNIALKAIENEKLQPMTYEFSIPIKTVNRIETNWFRKHKGEVKLKTIITFNGSNFNVITYHKGLFSKTSKSRWSKAVTERIIKTINDSVKTAN